MTPLAPLDTKVAAALGDGSSVTDRAQLKQVAQQFEAILLRQMLAEARKTEFDDGLFSGEGLKTFREMQDSRFAEVAATSDTLGLARMIETQLARLLPGKE